MYILHWFICRTDTGYRSMDESGANESLPIMSEVKSFYGGRALAISELQGSEGEELLNKEELENEKEEPVNEEEEQEKEGTKSQDKTKTVVGSAGR